SGMIIRPLVSPVRAGSADFRRRGRRSATKSVTLIMKAQTYHTNALTENLFCFGDRSVLLHKNRVLTYSSALLEVASSDEHFRNLRLLPRLCRVPCARWPYNRSGAGRAIHAQEA